MTRRATEHQKQQQQQCSHLQHNRSKDNCDKEQIRAKEFALIEVGLLEPSLILWL